MLFMPWLWAVFTVIAAFFQTLRNAMQRELDAQPRHCRRDACAIFVRLSLRAGFPHRAGIGNGRAAAGAELDILAMGDRRRFRPGCRHGADADRHGRALIRRHHRLSEDRSHPSRDLRLNLPRRCRHLSDDDRNPDGHGGRAHHVDQARRNGRRRKTDAHRPCLRRHVRAVGGRISRRHSRSSSRQLRDGGDLHARDRPRDAGG